MTAINPAHYTSAKIQPIDFIESQGLGFHEANVIKYLARAGLKENAQEDRIKALNYLWRRITGEWMPAEIANKLSAKSVTNPETKVVSQLKM